MFLTYVIKVDKREVIRLYFKRIHVLQFFLVFQENYPYAVIDFISISLYSSDNINLGLNLKMNSEKVNAI